LVVGIPEKAMRAVFRAKDGGSAVAKTTVYESRPLSPISRPFWPLFYLMRIGYARVSTDDQNLDLQIFCGNRVGRFAMEARPTGRVLLRIKGGS
jgi:hypothetical protein